jgi:UDP-glucose:(heptosyl)LPS alpha-1,3-glucosyltransferase
MGKEGMKIAFVRRDYTAKGGGAEKYLVTLSRELATMGEEVHIFAHAFDQPPHPAISFHPVSMIPIISPLKNFSFAFNVRTELKKFSFDIICSLSRGFHHDIFRITDGLHLYHMKQRYTNRVNFLIKNVSPRHQTLLYLEKKSFLCPQLKRVIANSQLAKTQVTEYYGIPKEKVEVIYNGFDPAAFNPSVREKYRPIMRKKLGIQPDDVVLLFVAMDYERKGLNFLLETLSLVKKNKVVLFVAGKGDSGKYQRITEKLRLTDRVKFIGYYPRVEEVYGMGDMLVLPTLYDPFSNCCLEALACGIPVITTRQNGASELIEDGKNGFIVENGFNARALAEKIDLLLPRETRGKMGEQAFRSVKDLTVETHAGKILRLFQDVLAEKKGSEEPLS